MFALERRPQVVTLTQKRRGPSSHAAAKRTAVESFRRFARGEGLPEHPIEIYVEVSNVCDLKCVMCPRFSALNPDRKTWIQSVGPGFLAPEPLSEVLDPVLSGALVVHAFGYGEPTIHPDFGHVLEHLAHFDALVDFFTNGMHLTEELVERLVRLAVHQITVSFSGSTADHYENIYQGGKFDRVLAGLARLRDAKRAADAIYPLVCINSLSWEHHMLALDRFVSMMADHGVDRVEVTHLLEHTTVLPELEGHAADMRSPAVREALARAYAVARTRGIRLDIHPSLLAEVAGPARSEETARQAPAVPVETMIEVAKLLPVHPPAPGGPPPIRVLDADVDSIDEMRASLVVRGPAPGAALSRPFVCLEPFKTMYVRRGGQVKACCYMNDEAPMLGDVKRSGGQGVWDGLGYRVFRGAILNGEYPQKACASCLANRQAPPRHGVDKMLNDYATWHASVFGTEFSREAFADLTAAPDGRSITERLAANRPDCFEPPGARERETKLASLVEGVTRLEGVPPALFEGFLDYVAGTGVAGWLWSPLYPDLRLTVAVDLDGVTIGETVARTFRPDLVAAAKGDGRYGFALHFGAQAGLLPGQAISVRIGGTRCQLLGSPAVVPATAAN